jgi:hypothetical protein
MKRHTIIPSTLRIAAVNVAALSMALLYSPHTFAAFGDLDEIRNDSELVLEEKPGDAPYASRNIRFKATAEGAELTVVEDGKRTIIPVDSDVYQSLFEGVLKSDAESLDNQEAGPRSGHAPGHSRFLFSIREGGEEHHWISDGVDNLDDTRYRSIVNQIIATVKRLTEGGGDDVIR